jgi:hypothetical protein
VSGWNKYRVRPWELTRTLPRPELATLTDDGCPFTVDGGAAEGFALLLLQLARGSKATTASVALANRTNGFLRVGSVKIRRHVLLRAAPPHSRREVRRGG